MGIETGQRSGWFGKEDVDGIVIHWPQTVWCRLEREKKILSLGEEKGGACE